MGGSMSNKNTQKLSFVWEDEFMTAEEFKAMARAEGVSDSAIDREIAMHDKFIRMGMQPATYEEMLAAIRTKSCVAIFESSLNS